jgi:hypothetical protein
MKKTLLLFTLLSPCLSAFAQILPNVNHCGFDKARKALENSGHHSHHTSVPRAGLPECVVIPVVVHLYGQVMNGYPVNEEIIAGAFEMLNADFHGLNNDFDLVHQDFLALRESMPQIEFVLAQKDLEGNPFDGIVYHPVAAGYANWQGYDEQVQADAWDNYRYMNLYVMNDLYDDGSTNNSGYAYFPNEWMSDNNLDRIVYNGAYLGANCDWEPEFASTLTHEYGHWLNLYHTFADGCAEPNDEVPDTPMCDFFGDNYDCHPNSFSTGPVNCEGELINTENYMDYSGAYGCYRMFTQGQVERMFDALYHPSRFPLWQEENLILTGLDEYCEPGVSVSEITKESATVIYPQPATERLHIQFARILNTNIYVEVFDLLGASPRGEFHSLSNGLLVLDVSGWSAGTYFVRIPELGVGEKVLINN